MFNIFKAELYRIKNETSVKVLFFVAIAFSLLGVLNATSYYNMFDNYKYDITSDYINLFSINNNVGLILSIIFIILTCKEYNYGTIRNKVIVGYSRTTIFTAKMLAFLLSSLILMIEHIVLFYIFALMFQGKITLPSFIDVIKIFIIGILNLVLAFTFLYTISMIMQSVGKTIGVYLGITFGLSIIFSIILTSLLISKENDQLISFLKWIPFIQISYYNVESYLELFIKSFIGCVGLSSILFLFGNYLFKKKDIK